MVTDILNVNLTLINIMESYLPITLLILLLSLVILFAIFIADYFQFKERIEKILDLNTEITDGTQEIINITKKVNDSVGDICKLNNRLIVNLRNLLQENNALRNKLEDKENNNE